MPGKLAEWNFAGPRGMELCGFIPTFISVDDPRPIREQLNEAYAHGGGWFPFGEGTWKLLRNTASTPLDWRLEHLGDPAFHCVGWCEHNGEKLVVFTHAWAAIVQPNGSYEVAGLMTTIAEYEERRERLCTALESGEYAQTFNTLHDHIGYCCLGVACEVSGLGRWEEGDGVDEYVVGLRRTRATLPEPVREYYGFRSRTGGYWGEGSPSLTDHNDIARFSFREIATIIRSKPAGLFIEGTF